MIPLRFKQHNMRKFLLPLTAIIFAGILFVGCNRGDNPKSVASTWLTSFYHMDYDGAKKVSTEETKAMLTQLAQFSGMIPDSTKQQYKKITVDVKEVKEDGDKADVTYMLNDPSAKDAKDASSGPQVLHRVKKDGKWLVQFSKNDSMGGGDDKGAPADKSGGDSTQAPSPSSGGDTPPADAPGGDKK